MAKTKSAIELTDNLTPPQTYFVLGFLMQRLDRKGVIRKIDVAHAVAVAHEKVGKK